MTEANSRDYCISHDKRATVHGMQNQIVDPKWNYTTEF